MSIRKLTSILITALILFGVSSAFGEDYKTKLTLTLKSGSAIANPTYDVSYTLTVPESLTISNKGWNAIGSMTVAYSGTGDNVGFSTDKKLVVTASSTNDFKLVANGGSSSISYFLATSESGTKTTTFEFTAEQITAGAEQTIGVNVEDFSSKANGTYTDEITYTVAIQDAGTTTTTTTVTCNGSDITGSGKSFTKDGVTITTTAGDIDFDSKEFLNGGTFTTTLGNFTKIEVTASMIDATGTGWSVSGQTATWTGEASNSVSFSYNMMEILTIVFTIAQ